jgi:hypothetical protein
MYAMSHEGWIQWILGLLVVPCQNSLAENKTDPGTDQSNRYSEIGLPDLSVSFLHGCADIAILAGIG